jgi:membrane protease YdiL (CAAX protease family)
MHISRSFAFLFGLSLLALFIAAPQPPNPIDLAIGAVLSAGLIALGLRAAAPFGRGAPLLERLGQRDFNWGSHGRHLVWALLAGTLLGAVLLLLLLLLISIEPRLSARFAARANQPFWMPVALAVEASILEELIFRLFLMSGLVWLLTRFHRTDQVQPSAVIFWVALGVSALGFGLVHLPSWLAVVDPTAVLVTVVLVLNGLGGLLLGQVYWRWGIEAAILCHFAGDMMIQSIGPRLVGD